MDLAIRERDNMERIMRDHFVCACESVEHELIFSYFGDEKGDEIFEVFCEVHLAPLNFWRRLWHGIKYIFGYRSMHGDFEEFIFHRDDADKLQRVVDALKGI